MQLNLQQQLAVDTIEGPVIVVAGPGTGKTQVLALHIAHILSKTDTQPDAILALTYTDAAAKNMRQRLISTIGSAAYRVRIQTFHSFCDEVIKDYPEYFPLQPAAQILSDLEKIKIWRHLLKTLDLHELRTPASAFHYLKDIAKNITDLKKEGLSPSDFKKLLAKLEVTGPPKALHYGGWTKWLAKMRELQLIYDHYQKQLAKKNFYDYEDMIMMVLQAFSSHNDLLLNYQENILYFLVDEYQDTNSAQNKVVNLLATYWGEVANLFVVGDPWQTIYRFQGASLENVLEFTQKYPSARKIVLEHGYRCSQNIYDGVAKLINKPALKSASKTMGPKIKLVTTPDSTIEAIFVAEEIKKLLQQGEKAADIAILYKQHQDANAVKETLTAWGIKFDLSKGRNLLDSEEIKQLINFLFFLHELRSAKENNLFAIMNYAWINLDRLLVMKFFRYLASNKKTIDETLAENEFAELKKWYQAMMLLSAKEAELTFTAWFSLILNVTGFLDFCRQQNNSLELISQINALYEEIKNWSGAKKYFCLTDFVDNITHLQAENLSLEFADLNLGEGAVRLSTVHSAKGLEWKYVFILKTIDKKWGHSRSRDRLPLPEEILPLTKNLKSQQNQDDLRLFYVALSRAKRQVYLTFPQTETGHDQKEYLLSEFVHRLQTTELIENVDISSLINNQEAYLPKLFAVPQAPDFSDSEKNWLRDLLADFSLSVSSLNTYLRSKQEFYENVILRLPKAKADYLAFGTAVHSALEYFYRHFKENKNYPDINSALNIFTRALKKEILTPTDFIRWQKQGKLFLTNYLKEKQITDLNIWAIEKNYSSFKNKILLDDIVLTGKIDRIDLLDKDKKSASRRIKVVDYKTGRPKSQNEILGLTQSANISEEEKKRDLPKAIRGPMKRQLLFYKLLLDLDKNNRHQVTTGEFDFIQPNPSGKLVSRQFTLLDEEVEELKKLIKQVMKEIRDLKFLPAQAGLNYSVK